MAWLLGKIASALRPTCNMNANILPSATRVVGVDVDGPLVDVDVNARDNRLIDVNARDNRIMDVNVRDVQIAPTAALSGALTLDTSGLGVVLVALLLIVAGAAAAGYYVIAKEEPYAVFRLVGTGLTCFLVYHIYFLVYYIYRRIYATRTTARTTADRPANTGELQHRVEQGQEDEEDVPVCLYLLEDHEQKPQYKTFGNLATNEDVQRALRSFEKKFNQEKNNEMYTPDGQFYSRLPRSSHDADGDAYPSHRIHEQPHIGRQRRQPRAKRSHKIETFYPEDVDSLKHCFRNSELEAKSQIRDGLPPKYVAGLLVGRRGPMRTFRTSNDDRHLEILRGEALIQGTMRSACGDCVLVMTVTWVEKEQVAGIQRGESWVTALPPAGPIGDFCIFSPDSAQEDEETRILRKKREMKELDEMLIKLVSKSPNRQISKFSHLPDDHPLYISKSYEPDCASELRASLGRRGDSLRKLDEGLAEQERIAFPTTYHRPVGLVVWGAQVHASTSEVQEFEADKFEEASDCYDLHSLKDTQQVCLQHQYLNGKHYLRSARASQNEDAFYAERWHRFVLKQWKRYALRAAVCVLEHPGRSTPLFGTPLEGPRLIDALHPHRSEAMRLHCLPEGQEFHRFFEEEEGPREGAAGTRPQVDWNSTRKGSETACDRGDFEPPLNCRDCKKFLAKFSFHPPNEDQGQQPSSGVFYHPDVGRSNSDSTDVRVVNWHVHEGRALVKMRDGQPEIVRKHGVLEQVRDETGNGRGPDRNYEDELFNLMHAELLKATGPVARTTTTVATQTAPSAQRKVQTHNAITAAMIILLCAVVLYAVVPQLMSLTLVSPGYNRAPHPNPTPLVN